MEYEIRCTEFSFKQTYCKIFALWVSMIRAQKENINKQPERLCRHDTTIKHNLKDENNCLKIKHLKRCNFGRF